MQTRTKSALVSAIAAAIAVTGCTMDNNHTATASDPQEKPGSNASTGAATQGEGTTQPQ